MQKLSIGRIPDCDIVVNEPTVSKMHAELIINNDNVTVRDLGSTNGTYVNGVKIQSTQILKKHDIVKVGNSIVQWENYVSISPTDINIINKLTTWRPAVPSSFALIIILFFSTFCVVSCDSGQKLASIKGIQLVTGTTIKGPDMGFGMITGKEQKGEKLPPVIWAIIAFSAAIIGFASFFIFKEKYEKITLSMGIIGTISLLILQFGTKNELEKKGLQVDFLASYWLAVIAFMIASLLGYLKIKQNPNNNSA